MKTYPRYHRQTILAEIGQQGQKLLEKTTISIIGLGALGTVSAELLLRSGATNLTLIDNDTIEETNLQRQLLFQESDLKKNKAIAAKKHLLKINKKAKITALTKRLNDNNLKILKKSHLILDCTDNLETRFLINDFCKQHHLPWIYASAIKTYGYVLPILPDGPCLRCFLKNSPIETCSTSGVINTITTSIAALQITQAIKIITKKLTESKLYYYNIYSPELKIITIHKNKNCPICKTD
ncbi:HesA/MoeB/ThiF family protein [Candidatus Woesearchaeota archaeon]|nr:HesA/MoeB/ThiF family protein [Candidatus Woesearchaeota archaeon]